MGYNSKAAGTPAVPTFTGRNRLSVLGLEVPNDRRRDHGGIRMAAQQGGGDVTSLLRRCFTLLRAPVNSVSFATRNTIGWRRGCPVLVNEDKVELFDYLEGPEQDAATSREADLRERYGLGELRRLSSRLDYRDNLWLLDNLERLLADVELPQPIETVERLRVLDIGAKNWNYVFALQRFFGDASLMGVEVDGHGIYPDLRSRADHAEAYVSQTGNPRVHYQVTDFLDLTDRHFDVVTLFYPFLTRHALLAWGLPLGHFKPRRILARALDVLRPGGLLVVFNQSNHERSLLHGMLRGLGVDPSVTMPLQSKLVGYWYQTQDRWGTVVRRPDHE
jgi:SAM-dependent methyltransferase